MPLSSSFKRKNAIEANEEWPEMITLDGKPGETRRVKMQFNPPEPKTIALKTVSTNDLSTLKKKDPFLYYSIPGIRSAKVLGKEVDVNNLGTCAIRSCPSRLFTQISKSYQPAVTATRTKRISFECHPDLLFENLSIEEGDESSDFDEDEDEDILDVILERVSSASNI